MPAIGAAIASAATWLATSAAVSAFLVKLALTVGLSYISTPKVRGRCVITLTEDVDQ